MNGTWMAHSFSWILIRFLRGQVTTYLKMSDICNQIKYAYLDTMFAELSNLFVDISSPVEATSSVSIWRKVLWSVCWWQNLPNSMIQKNFWACSLILHLMVNDLSQLYVYPVSFSWTDTNDNRRSHLSFNLFSYIWVPSFITVPPT